MSTDGVDNSRRRFLTAATSVVGAVGTVGLIIPFASSMNPSARAKAAGAPVEVDISKLEPGGMITVEWRGKPVWIVRRTKDNMDDLKKNIGHLTDAESGASKQPEYAKNFHRSRTDHAEIIVMEGICTHLGCSPKYRPELAPADLGDDWMGGYFCPCHGSKFDLSGRVYSGVPAPSNLPIPPHMYLSETVILVGLDTAEGAA
ncbi:MAG: ubiquinol-cytochrome c reductase iron-sulfur subunit [Gammaproteobacteria bacterium]|nr:ubiquinol-cytochrome c reductase iron-sulfur subunit [Gammaproteobacteria bacterium]MDH5653614.1 ubiquinol-cytochrome c reductase iron-sulfur subunit [Gammaproteobacteria bacterium]